jgi:hypothetical protein
MALPPLEADFILRDNVAEVSARMVAAARLMDQSLTAAQASVNALVSAFERLSQSAGGVQRIQGALEPLNRPIAFNPQAVVTGLDGIVTRLNSVDKEAAEARQHLQQLSQARPTPIAPAADNGATAAAQAASQARIAAFQAEQQQRQQIFNSSIGQLTRFESLLTAAQQTEEQKRVALSSSAGQARRQALQSSLSTFSGGEIDQLTTRLLELQRQAQVTREKISQIDQRTSGPRSNGLTATQNEVRERERLYQELSNVAKAEEAEITQAVRREAQNRAQATRAETQSRGQAFNAVGALRGAAGVVGVGIGVREIAQQAVELTKLGTAAQRASDTFGLLLGSAERGAAAMRGIREASGNTVTNLEAGQIANKAFALGMAKTGEELERVTRFAVTASRVLGGDVAGTLDNLALAASNLSFRRLDQMGVSASQVKTEMDRLKATTTGLSQEQLFLQATLNVGERTFANLGGSAVTSASGLEILSARLRQLREDFGGLVATSLDAPFRDLALRLGGGGIPDEIKIIEDRIKSLQSLSRGGITGGAGIALPAIEGASQLAEQQAVIVEIGKNATAALASGRAGAKEFAAGFEEVARQVALSGRVTDENIQSLQRLAQQYGIAQGSVALFAEAQRRAAEQRLIASLEDQRTQAQGSEGGFFGIGAVEADIEKVKRLDDALASARANFAKGIPIILDPQIKELVPADLRAALGSEIYDEVAAKTKELADAQELLKQAQFSPSAQEAGLVSVRQAIVNVTQADLDLAKARVEVAQASAQYNNALRSGSEDEQKLASSRLASEQSEIKIAEARQAAAQASLNLISAERALGDAYAQAGATGADAAQQALVIAQAQNEAAQAALRAATAQAEAVDLQAEAAKKFAAATLQAEQANRTLVDSVSGLPVAFDIARVKGEDLSGTLQQLILDAQQLSISAQQSSFGLARGLIPSLGLGGALGQAQQFQSQIQQATNTFLQANNQRVQAGQSPIDTGALDFAIAGIQQYQQALVSDSTRTASQVGQTFDDLGKRIDDALSGVLDGILKPTTGGLIPEDVMNELLPREDALDEQARRLADVAVNGFKSPWVDGLRDLQLIPDDVFAQGEEAVRRFAAGAVRDHTEGLTTAFYDVDAAVQQVIEHLQSQQNRARFLDQVREQVKAVAGDIDDLDLQEALGVDVGPQRAAQATKSALAGLPTPDEIAAQMIALFSGGGTVSTAVVTSVSDAVRSGMAAATTATATGESPLTKTLTITEDQKAIITTSATTAISFAGEAMVTQVEQGAYGQRSIEIIIAAIEAKKVDLQKSGRAAGGWLGGALLDEFGDTVPIGLLNILVTELVPMLITALAEERERTGGTGVQ